MNAMSTSALFVALLAGCASEQPERANVEAVRYRFPTTQRGQTWDYGLYLPKEGIACEVGWALAHPGYGSNAEFPVLVTTRIELPAEPQRAVRKTRDRKPHVDVADLVLQAVTKLQQDSGSEAARLKEAIRQAVAVLSAAMK